MADYLDDDKQLDLSERGRAKDGSPLALDRRLFMQFTAFGGCRDAKPLARALEDSGIDAALYADANDARGIGLIAMSEDADFFVSRLREILNEPPFSQLTQKGEYAMFGRTYSLGYEPDLHATLIAEPRRKALDGATPWAIWYPLQRAKNFENLTEGEQRAVLGEHGKIGFKFGKAGFARDIRLACHGLDRSDNDFVIGVLGRELYPLSALIQTMRKTKQTSMYLEKLGPFFIGRAIWQSKI
ncbi:MAG: chlorite dismutase family protein [Deltaproteobacteria bacterium]